VISPRTCLRAAAFFVAACLPVAAGGCGSGGSPDSSATPSGGGQTVSIADYMYKPASLSVPAGTTVEFSN
jgi:plastocyanin